MSNRIDTNLHALLNKAGQKLAEAGKGAAAGSGEAHGGKGSGGDKVVLTEQSQVLAGLEKAVAGMPAIDQARVDAVKADIENGNYEINLDNLAELLMRSELPSDD